MLKRLTIDDELIHSHDQDNIWLTSDEVDGFGVIGLRVNAYDKTGEDGGRVSSAYLESRLLKLGGRIRGASIPDYMLRRTNLQGLANPQRDANTLPIPRRIVFKTLDDVEYFVEGHITRFQLDSKNVNWAGFLIQVICPDPQIYVNNLITSDSVTRPVSGGVIYPVTYPAIYGESTGGVLVVNNPGNAYSWPILRLSGSMTNPSITHVQSGTVMQLYATLSSTDSVVIDMKEKTIVLNGTSPFLYTKTDISDWFSILPGENTFYFSTGSTTDTGTFSLSFYEARLGI